MGTRITFDDVIFMTRIKKEKEKEKGYALRERDNEGAIYRATVSVVKRIAEINSTSIRIDYLPTHILIWMPSRIRVLRASDSHCRCRYAFRVVNELCAFRVWRERVQKVP